MESAVSPTRDGLVTWAPEVAARYRAEGLWAGRPLGDLLCAAARRTPGAVAVVDGRVRLTFAELTARADGAALRLRDLGVGPDDRVLVQLPNCWEFVVLLVACLRLGAVPVLTLTAHRRTEIAGIAAHTEARAIAVPAGVPGDPAQHDHLATALDVAAGSRTLEHVLVPGGDPRALDLHALLAPAADPAGAAAELDARPPDASAVALFMLSGGTTGTPKAIPRTHDDLAYMMRRAAEVSAVDATDAYLAVLPLGHGFPVTGPGALGTLIAGGRVVLCPSPAPQNALPLIAAEGVTITSVVPAIVQRWLEDRGTADLSSLRVLQVGGSRLPDDVAARIGPELGCTLQQVFGMSEGLLCMTRLDDPVEDVVRSQGRPVSPHDEILVVDDAGTPVPPGESGVLLTRGPYTPWSYYRPAAQQAAVHLPGGWYRTGDVVRQLPGGDLVVEGREKDVINRGGEKVGADEVEDLVRACAGVADVAAVAMPDPVLGERVCVYVVPEPGAVVELAAVRTAVRTTGVAHHVLPDRLVTVPELPLTPVGKVDKVGLRADVAAIVAAEVCAARAA